MKDNFPSSFDVLDFSTASELGVFANSFRAILIKAIVCSPSLFLPFLGYVSLLSNVPYRSHGRLDTYVP